MVFISHGGGGLLVSFGLVVCVLVVCGDYLLSWASDASCWGFGFWWLVALGWMAVLALWYCIIYIFGV